MQARLSFLAAALALGLVTACAPSPEREREVIERELLAAPESRVVWEAIKRHYPQEYAELVEGIRTLNREERAGSSAMRRMVKKWLRAHLTEIYPALANASPSKLRDVTRADLALSEHLAKEAPDACATFTIDGSIWFPPGEELNTFAADLGRLNAATVIAAADGRDRPVDHARPSQTEFDKVASGLAASGVSPGSIRAIGDAAAMRAMSSTEACALGLAIRRAIVRLPDDALARFVSFQISEQFRED